MELFPSGYQEARGDIRGATYDDGVWPLGRP
jgi:hypothetical protein